VEISWEKAATVAALIGLIYGPIFWFARRYPQQYKRNLQFAIVVIVAILSLGVLQFSTWKSDYELTNIESLTTVLSTNARNGHLILPAEIDELTRYAQTVKSYNARMTYVIWFILLNSMVLPFAYKLADWGERKGR
jgi:hypothetical protein